MSTRIFRLQEFGRRGLLRGLLGGAAVTVALPLLDVFLNENGTALASGRPLPVRFGTWFWGCGMNPSRWNPVSDGATFELPPELAAIAPVRAHLNVLSGFNVMLDGKANSPHHSGYIGLRTGLAPAKSEYEAPTLDVLIGDAIGGGTRFRSLEMTATGDPRHTYSYRSATLSNPSEASPAALYARIFGPEFQDPNAAEFKPDPEMMVRRSVLSSVRADRERLMALLGTEDRARLDEYFTALRQTERQVALQLEKPPPAEACRAPGKPADGKVGTSLAETETVHRLMTEILALALTCNQTRLFNMVFSSAFSELRRPGASVSHHQSTHEENIDPATGVQPTAAYFSERSMASWAEFVAALAGIREGAGSLLDNCLVFAHSDVSFAKGHDVLGIPMMLAGRAGGRVRTGLHVKGSGQPVTRVGFTAMEVMGMTVDHWGSGSMQTGKPLSEILV
jgi:hypothetical protein